MRGDEQESQVDGELPSVRDLARLLHDRIKAYKGGMEGVWSQIDGRFKRQKGKSITGLKEAPENKISHAAFKKAFQRLGSSADSARLEKMRFQINGNPLLLMNIFDILGINGYKDLLKLDFKKPDTADEIFYINNRLKKISGTLTNINERIEAGHKSINTYKLNADFEEMTKRLYSVLLQNDDPLLQETLYHPNMNMNKWNETWYKAMNTSDIIKIMELQKETQRNSDMLFRSNAIGQLFLNCFEEERKRVILMILIFFDYKGYLFNNSILKEYKKRLNGLNLNDSKLESTFVYILSPFFIILLYLQIAILFMIRIDRRNKGDRSNNSCFITKEGEDEDILKITGGEDDLLKYILNCMQFLFKEIKTILKILLKNNVENIPQEKYEMYKIHAAEIVETLKKIFIDNKIDDYENMANIIKKYKTPEDLYKIKDRVYSGIYMISYSDLEKIELVKEKILKLKQMTVRDLNG